MLAREGAHKGLIARGVMTVLVSALPDRHQRHLGRRVPWSAFAVGGMTIGMPAHWWFGYRNLETELTARQHKIEERAAHLR